MCCHNKHYFSRLGQAGREAHLHASGRTLAKLLAAINVLRAIYRPPAPHCMQLIKDECRG